MHESVAYLNQNNIATNTLVLNFKPKQNSNRNFIFELESWKGDLWGRRTARVLS